MMQTTRSHKTRIVTPPPIQSDDELAAKLRRQILEEIHRELDDLNMEAEYRDVVHLTAGQVTAFSAPLRYTRRHLTDLDLAALPLRLLRILPEAEGFLDREISPTDAAEILRIASPKRAGFVADALAAAIEQPKVRIEATEDRPDLEKAPRAVKEAPPASDRALGEWFAKYSSQPEYPNLSEESILAAAHAAFPENQISRQRIRDLRGPQKRGPKPIRGKLAAKLPRK